MALAYVTRDSLRMSYIHAILRGAGFDAEVRTTGAWRKPLFQIFVPDEKAVAAKDAIERLEAQYRQP